MPRYETRAVLAGAYRGKLDTTLTHVIDTSAERVLCGRVRAENLADANADDETAEATCATCAKRDPRAQRGPEDGPRALKHLFQF